MSNSSHAYNDYNGPRLPGVKTSDKVPVEEATTEDETNPCLAFSWMEGDSLAPPCGSSISLIHDMLEFASVHQDDVFYDVSLVFLLEQLVRSQPAFEYWLVPSDVSLIV